MVVASLNYKTQQEFLKGCLVLMQIIFFNLKACKNGIFFKNQIP
jgi:hypothetical protein